MLLTRVTATSDRGDEFLFPFGAALFGGAAIVCALRAESIIQRFPALTWLGRYLGRVSYSTYLFHIILIELIGALLQTSGVMVQLGLFVTILFGLTTVFYIYFERPILAARPRYQARPAPPLDALNAVAPADRQ